MERKMGWLTSGAFAALCGTTKETLRHYKELGLLAPAHRGENGYFYYDAEQFYDYYAIAVFRQTGTPLEEIRRCLRGAGRRRDLPVPLLPGPVGPHPGLRRPGAAPGGPGAGDGGARLRL